MCGRPTVAAREGHPDRADERVRRNRLEHEVEGEAVVVGVEEGHLRAGSSPACVWLITVRVSRFTAISHDECE